MKERKDAGKKILLAALLCGSALLLAGCGKGSKAYEKGEKLAGQGNYEDASRQFQKAIAANKERAEYYISYGMALNHLGQYQEALQQFELAYQDTKNSISDQNNKQVLLGEAIAYYNLGDYQKTLELCEEAEEYKGASQLKENIASTRAAALQMLGRTEEACALYDEILDQDKEAWDVYLKRGTLKEALEDYEGAKEDYMAVVNSQKSYEGYFALYRLYQSQGEEEDARQIMNELLSGKADTPEDVCQFGKACYYLEDYETAAAYLEEAREGGSKEANYYLGLVNMIKEDYQEALNCFEAYLNVTENPESAMVYNQIAGCYLELEEYEKAQEYLTKGLERSDASARQALLKNQTILYEKLGMFKKARKSAKEYLAAYAGDAQMEQELEFIKTRIRQKVKKEG